MRFSVLYSATLGLILAVGGPLLAQGAKDAKDVKESLPGGKSLPEWLRDFKNPDPSVRENAIRMVTQFGSISREAVPALITALGEKDSGLRGNAVLALGMIGLDDKNMKNGVAALVKLLSDTQGIIRAQAATALGRQGPNAFAAIPELAKLAKDPFSWEIRKAACYALGQVAMDPRNGPHPLAIGALVNAMTDASAAVRLEAIMSLVVLGPPTPAAIGLKQTAQLALLKALKDREEAVVVWAHMGLMRMDQVSKSEVAAIAKYLRSKDTSARSQAIRALATLGTEAVDCVPELETTAANDFEPVVIVGAMYALMHMGNEGKAALARLAKHENEDIKKAAADALQVLAANPVKPKEAK